MTIVSVSDSWVTWEEAAVLAGVRVPTIEHAVRVGRISRRPRSAGGPTLDRASVLSWADWYRETQADIARRRDAREASRQDGRLSAPKRRPVALLTEAMTKVAREALDRNKPVMAWLSVPEAAARLGCSEDTLRRWAEADLLVVETIPPSSDRDTEQASSAHASTRDATFARFPQPTVSSGRTQVRVSESSVDDLLRVRTADADAWVTQARAAEIVGCSPARIPAMVAEGLLTRRPGPRIQPSISRASAERAAVVWAERARAEAVACQERREARPANGPPDDKDVWVSTATAAIALGLSRNRVGDRIRAGRLPAVLCGNRYWLRRADVETAAAARAFQLLAVSSPDA